MEVNEPNAEYFVPVRRRASELKSLPDDWDVIELAERAMIQSGIAKNANAALRDPIAVPYLRVANVQDGYLDLREVSTISIERSDLNRYAVLPGDVLMNEGGDLDKLGRGALWHGQINPCVHQNHVFVVRCQTGLVPEYLNAWTSTAHARRYFMLAGRQTTNLASINKTSLGELTVAVPPNEHEQRAIAEALTDADALIDSLEQLLTKKRQIKQGAMEELLTGKRRLLQGAAAWRQMPLGSLGRWSGGMTPSMARADYWFPADVPWLSSGDLKTALLSESAKFISKAAVRDGATTVVPAKSVVVVMRSGILRKYFPVGITLDVMAINQDLKAVQPNNEVTAEFLLHALTYWGERILATCLKSGTTVESIELRWLKAFTIELPTVPEQEEIAGVLSEIDSDISALEARLTKARAVKQAMAQALLTGRIRLVEPAS